MIRFCDGMVCNVNIEEYQPGELPLLAVQNKMQNYVFLLYENEEYLGYTNYYEMILHKDDIYQSIIQEQILFDENVFVNCTRFLEQKKIYSFIPVFDYAGNIMYMAYSDTRKEVNDDQIVRFTHNLYDNPAVDIRDVYDGVEAVNLFDCNEISYNLYRYFKNKGIPYKLYGEKWKLLGESVYDEEMRSTALAPDYATMNIFGEVFDTVPSSDIDGEYFGKKPIIDHYLFLYKLINFSYDNAIYQVASQLKERDVNLCLVNIPEALDDLTPAERYRKENQINLNQIDALDSQEKMDSLIAVYGEQLIEQYNTRETFKDRVTAYFQGVSSFTMLTETRKKNIYLLGPCITYQSDLMAKDTMVNRIQEYVNKICPGEYKVTAISIPVELSHLFQSIIHSMKINRDDVFVFIYHNLQGKGKYNALDLTEVYMRRNEQDWFSNNPIHVNVPGSHAIAQYICDEYINTIIKKGTDEKVAFYPTVLDPSEIKELNKYFAQYAEYVRDGNNGAIVMNCNPYTNGHDYLIRTAARKVDTLYIFVVEEDKSFFSFEDRYNLVKKNTEKYENIIVLPSGKMILSANTFGAYFQKEQYHEIECDATDDMKLFGLAVAPYFNIKIRFSGTEPKDIVTNNYLNAMLEQLPVYGICVDVIERKVMGDDVVSATNVRAYLKDKRWDEIRKIVPPITYEYLEKRFK